MHMLGAAGIHETSQKCKYKLQNQPALQLQGRNSGIKNAAPWERRGGLTLIQNVTINCKINARARFAISRQDFRDSKRCTLGAVETMA